jgi:hypothetical protein
MTVGDAFAALLDDKVNSERSKKASLEARGLAIITASGTLVTLLLGLAAVLTKAQGFAPSTTARFLLTGAIAAFLVAATLGIYCNIPLRYQEIAPESLKGLTAQEVWAADGRWAQREIAAARLGELMAACDANERKAKVLLLGAGVQVLAIVLTGAAAAVILLRG